MIPPMRIKWQIKLFYDVFDFENDIALSKSRNSAPLIHPDVNVAGNGSHAALYAVGRYEGVYSRT